MNETLIKHCYEQLKAVREQLREEAGKRSGECAVHKRSCLNMLHFLALKRMDVAALQNDLAKLALSSLGRSQFHIMYTINQEINMLGRLLGIEEPDLTDQPISFDEAFVKLTKRSQFLKSPKAQVCSTSIMVTLPSEAAEDSTLIEKIAKSNVSVVRINTAHDTPAMWRKMAGYVQQLNKTVRKDNPVKIYVDLAGPKIRTGKIRKVPEVFRASPKRMEQRIALVRQSLGSTCVTYDTGRIRKHATLAVEDGFFEQCVCGDFVGVSNEGSKERFFEILDVDDEIIQLRIDKKVEITPETELTLYHEKHVVLTSRLYHFNLIAEEIRLFEGDKLLISFELLEGSLVEKQPYKALISCTNRDVFNFVHVGEPIFIDDGKIELLIETISEMGVLCRVLNARPKGVVVREEKGMNFPKTHLHMTAITQEDTKNLSIIAEFADIIGLSFVQTREDILHAQELLAAQGASGIALVAKIETQMAVRNLPEILMQLLSHGAYAVMIARGDLAIEVGFVNLAVVQDEILELCESAHVPVIYATQVLENLMKSNLPSRAEIVDASLSQRADCVMLNKGPFTIKTVEVLSAMLDQMHKNFQKNRQLYGGGLWSDRLS